MLLAVACLLGSLLTGLPSLPARLACSALPACSFNVLLKASRAGQELVDLHSSSVPPRQPSRCGRRLPAAAVTGNRQADGACFARWCNTALSALPCPPP